VVYHRVLPESPAILSDPERPWPDEIHHALISLDVQALYSHQARAVDLVRSGRNTVVATPTASGKTFIYNLPVLEKILANGASKALYIFPLKALAQDQLSVFKTLSSCIKRVKPTAAIYDGDTSAWYRKKIRENLPNVILTNPEMLHLSFLPHHQKWADFFSGLEIVVIDEVHTYRGVMGSHMAQVFRRLQRICAFYGASPTFVFCSATISNPTQLAKQLTGLDVDGITSSGAPQGRRNILFIDPIEGAAQIAIQLLKAALHRELRTIVYTQSRKLTELIAMWSQNRSGAFAHRISAYRAGFLPEERRQIESKLANGDLLAVISTSALELGIDIGDLDLCLLVGYPGTIISTLQRAGRVGRSGQESALVLISGEDALDKYFMRHPEDLFTREPESAVINPYNRHILSRQLVCAAAELPLKEDESYIADSPMRQVLQTLCEEGELLNSADGRIWYSNRKFPHRKVDLRGSGNRYTIVDSKAGQTIGEIDAFRAFKETHPGAIYLHMGDTYRVDVLDVGTRTVTVSPAKVNYYTRVTAHKDTKILEVYEEKRLWDTTVCTGRLKVTDQVTGYDKWAIYTQRRLNRIGLDLPPLVFETDGLWFKIPTEVMTAAESKYLHFMGGIHAIEHAAIGIFPLLVLTDRNDLGGISTPFHQQTNGPAVFIYDGVPGGAGLTRQAFKRADDLLQYTLKVITECPCESGCPSCVHSPKCGSGNRPIDKMAAIFILNHMVTHLDDRKSREAQSKPLHEKTAPLRPLQRTAKYSDGVGHSSDNSFQPPAIPYSKKVEKNLLSRKKSPKSIRLKRRRKSNPLTAQPLIEIENQPHGIHFCVLDIETQRSAEEVGGWHRADLMRVSCAVLYDSEKDEYLEFLEDRVTELIGSLKRFDLVVGFNIKRFDYHVLSGYSDFDFRELHTLDILEDVHHHLGYRLSLDHLSKVTLGAKKTANGLQALKWWKEGRIREIVDYCRADVEITKALFQYGKTNGYLLFTNKAGNTVRIPVKW